jgi:hypothetical protein
MKWVFVASLVLAAAFYKIGVARYLAENPLALHNTQTRYIIVSKVLVPIVGCAVLVSAALADFGDIICSWKAPTRAGFTSCCRGLAWDGKYLWCNVSYSPGESSDIYRCVPTTGSAISSFHTYYLYNKVSGAANYRKYRGVDIIELLVYYQFEREQYIYRANFKGEILRSLKITNPPYVLGIADDGTNNWVVGMTSGYLPGVFKLNSTGSAISSFGLRDATYRGIAIQGDFFWVSVEDMGPYETFGAYKVRPGGSIAASFGRFGQLIFDCTYENNHLWIVTDNNIVRCVDVSNAPAVLPASVGRIKVLFK